MNARTIPPIPPNMRDLPIEARGYPVPYFVKWHDGKPDFRVSDMARMYECTIQRLCMICARPLGDESVFAMGPVSAITRANDEPPMHRQCAEFAAQTCPWMIRPGMKRITTTPKPEGTLEPEQLLDVPGAMYGGAPEVWTLYDAEDYGARTAKNGTLMFFLGAPRDMQWWRSGRRATREEVVTALGAAYDVLNTHPDLDHLPEETAKLDEALIRAMDWIPEDSY